MEYLVETIEGVDEAKSEVGPMVNGVKEKVKECRTSMAYLLFPETRRNVYFSPI